MVHQILAVPLLLKIVLSLFVILGANRLTGRLWAAVLAGIAVFALWTPRSPSELLTAFRMRVSSADDFFFIAILFLVVWMSAQMSAAGTMKRIVTAAEALLPRRSALAAVPMLIGFLPMPGGALFSAPLVEALDRENALDANLKARINYWFRHIWEYWWPLYPGALLAAEIFRLPPWLFMAIQIPLSLLAIGSGWFFLLRRVPPAAALGRRDELRRAARDAALQGIAPIAVLTLVYALVSFLLPSFAQISKYLPMVCGVVAAMAYLQARQALPAAAWKKILFSRAPRASPSPSGSCASTAPWPNSPSPTGPSPCASCRGNSPPGASPSSPSSWCFPSSPG
ncbi:MAG: DUF401 family protein [Spirochaetes bacterium]|nr:DUF401 family protein [Spirochaetota bacterium]